MNPCEGQHLFSVILQDVCQEALFGSDCSFQVFFLLWLDFNYSNVTAGPDFNEEKKEKRKPQVSPRLFSLPGSDVGQRNLIKGGGKTELVCWTPSVSKYPDSSAAGAPSGRS